MNDTRSFMHVIKIFKHVKILDVGVCKVWFHLRKFSDRNMIENSLLKIFKQILQIFQLANNSVMPLLWGRNLTHLSAFKTGLRDLQNVVRMWEILMHNSHAFEKNNFPYRILLNCLWLFFRVRHFRKYMH